MRFFQFGGYLSVLAIFAVDTLWADTDWQLGSNLQDSNAPDENWILADLIVEEDDVINSNSYQSSDFTSMDDGQLFVNDLQPGWLADVPNGECSSSNLAGRRRIKRSDGTCSTGFSEEESRPSSSTSLLAEQTEFDKAKCSALVFAVKSLLVCSSENILVGLPFDTLYDSTRGKQTFLAFCPKHKVKLGKKTFSATTNTRPEDIDD